MRTAGGVNRPVYEHPWFVRFTHWTNAIAVTVLALSGMQIFYAFPSFGTKVPQENLLQSIPEAIRLGGWLGGALQWHFTFMWIFALGGIFYAIAQAASGHFRTVVFTPSDVRGVWPMARHYFLFGRKPEPAAQYNPLQKLAYTSAVLLGALLLVTGIVMYKPVQFSALGVLVGGYHRARLLHFLAMCGLLAFIPGHLVMVAIHGWDNFRSMLIGWKMRPPYEPAGSLPPRSTAPLNDS
jgi:Ni/Fe-hydrogenase b-type cytochrome subunit